MTFEEFQHLARLFVVGALEPAEELRFQEARVEHGQAAEDYLRECSRLQSAFALSLQPSQPHPSAKDRLMSLIRGASKPEQEALERALKNQVRPGVQSTTERNRVLGEGI